MELCTFKWWLGGLTQVARASAFGMVSDFGAANMGESPVFAKNKLD